MFFSHGSNNARGVAILFRSGFDVNVEAERFPYNPIHLLCMQSH